MKSTYDNFIGVYDSIVDPSLCEKVIDFFEKSDFFPRKLENVDDKQLCMEDCRSNLSKELREPLMDCFRDYLNEYPLLRRSNFINSLTLLQKTEPTGGYHDFHTENLGWDNSSRSITWMIYLNNVEEGGETEWLYQKKKVKPTTGTAVIWPGGYTHYHRGNPPMSTKYIATGWIQSDWNFSNYRMRVGRDF
tara:strand:+ start:18 stop:590 length:573 start_codon:yes stop_codon:yes gene_type:complete